MNFLHILLKCHHRKLISSSLNGQYYFERPPTSQNIEYKVFVVLANVASSFIQSFFSRSSFDGGGMLMWVWLLVHT